MEFRLTKAAKVLLQADDTFATEDQEALFTQLLSRTLPPLTPLDDEAAHFLQQVSHKMLTEHPAPAAVSLIHVEILEGFRAADYIENDLRVFSAGDVVQVSQLEYTALQKAVPDKLRLVKVETASSLATYLVDVGGEI